MPILLIEAPTGVQADAKKKMMQDISTAIDEAYHMHDVRVWLREYSPDNVAQDGKIGAELVRPVCFLEAPELSNLDAKRKMTGKIQAAIKEAYEGLANTDETLLLMNHYPLENAGFAGALMADNPQAVAAIKHLNS